jgi:4-amino-4-deoxy-L-arabinose transferase-like glycosyltransferase
MDREPTVWDYFKAKVQFWKPSDLHFPPPEAANEPVFQDQISYFEEEQEIQQPVSETAEPRKGIILIEGMHFPWRALLAFLLAWVAQRLLEPPDQKTTMAIVFYFLAFCMLAWSFILREIDLSPDQEDLPVNDTFRLRWKFILLSILTGGLAYLEFGNHMFTALTVFLWLITIGLAIMGFIPEGYTLAPVGKKVKTWLKNPRWNVTLTLGTVLVVAVVVIAIFFRAYRLDQVPLNMTSDHAEKLLDVQDVLSGNTPVFFTRNTGREALQFYLTAAMIKLFNTGISFLSLKLGMMLAGLLTLPFIYLLGRELGSKRAGVIGVFFAGIAYWPNVIGRLGLRFALEPLFVAPALYFLLRGLRRKSRADFIWSGLALGIGLHGYTPIRILPFVILIAIILYSAHKNSDANRLNAVLGLLIITFVSLTVFLPLLRYTVDRPEDIIYRTFTRIGQTEQPYPGPVGLIFLSNLWNALIMFFYKDGAAWVHSIPNRPALDMVSAALFFLGVFLILFRYIQKRNWRDLFIVLSIPLLMMPSILSLAFPIENPSLNRTAGAIVPVFLVIGLMFDALLRAIETSFQKRPAVIFSAFLVFILAYPAMSQNYDLVFNQYDKEYLASSGNTYEMGQVIKGFATSIGTPDSVWVVGYPYWLDTRLVSITAGYPIRDYAIWPDAFATTQTVSGPKLFILNMSDVEDLKTLESMYPVHHEQTYISKTETKNFLLFFTPDFQTQPAQQ